MGRTKSKKTPSKTATVEPAAKVQNSPAAAAEEQQHTAAELLAKAEELIASYQFELAHSVCLSVIQNEPQHAIALETAASVELELGLVEEAHQVR